MTDFTETFKALITPYVPEYAGKNRTLGRLARAWQDFENNGSEEQLKTRLQTLAARWKERTDAAVAEYDSVGEYLASRRSVAKRAPWKIFVDLGLYAPPTEQDIEELQAAAADEADDTLETIEAKVAGNFAVNTITFDSDGGFIYIYYYPDELFNYDLIKQKAPQLQLEARPPRYKVGKAKNTVGAQSRVKGQIGTSIHQVMKIALVMQIKNESKIESILHNILEVRGKKCTDSVGDEWYFTSPEEIQQIIKCVRPDNVGV